MKKILFVLSIILISVLAINCSKDDDNVIPLSPKLYGTWNLDYYLNNGQLVEDVQCAEQVTYSFLSNGTYTKTTFADDGSSNCVIATIVNGKWESLSDTDYVLTPNGSIIYESLNITFLDNYTKFSIIYNENYTEVYVKRR